jgi:hypothetical protein
MSDVVAQVQEIVSVLRALVNKVKGSSCLTFAFEEAVYSVSAHSDASAEPTSVSLSKSCETRWNGDLRLAQSCLKHKTALQELRVRGEIGM